MQVHVPLAFPPSWLEELKRTWQRQPQPAALRPREIQVCVEGREVLPLP